MDNNLKNNLLGIEEEAPFIEADSLTSQEELERKKIARKRLFFVLLGLAIALFGLVIWQFVEIINLI